jgi:ATP-dependent Clp protease ATP-binding subunit ClpA
MADYQKAKDNIINNLTDYFSPEFINRIDKIVVFNPLDKEKIKAIVKLLLSDFEQRLGEKEYTLTYTEKVVEDIAKKVYNPEYGAREVRRFIQDNIEDIIAEFIIN